MARPTPLKRAIFDSGRTQRGIAAEAGLDEAMLSRIVNGLHASEATREAIARVLGREIGELWPPVPQERAA